MAYTTQTPQQTTWKVAQAQGYGNFSIPKMLERSARRVGVNQFAHGKRWWAPIKLRGFLRTVEAGNTTKIPPGFYVRQARACERSVIGSLVATENPRPRYKPLDLNSWWHVFYVTRKVVVSRYVTNDPYALEMASKSVNRAGVRFSTSQRVFKYLVKKAKKMVDPDEKILEEAMRERKERVWARDLMRTEEQYSTQKCNECDFVCGCRCGKCIRHCALEHSCTIDKKVWRESKDEREFVVEPFRRKRRNSGRAMREFLRCREGPAQAWFFPDKIEHTLNLPFMNSFFDSMKEVNNTVPWKRVFKDFAFMCAHLYTSRSKMSVMVSVTHFLSSLPLTEKIVAELLSKVTTWFTRTDENSGPAQAGVTESLFVPLLTLLGVVISALGVGKLPSDKSTNDFILRLSKIGACIKSIEIIKDYIEPTVKLLVDYVRVNLFGYSSTDLNAWKDYDDFCDRVQELNNSGFEERLKTEKDLVITIDDLLMRGDEMMKTLDRLRIPTIQRSRFNSAYAWLGRMRNEAAHCSAGKHVPRVPPVIFHFVGKTGVGKSEATSLLNARLLTSLGHTDENDLYTKVYYRDCGQERFDGYNSGVVGVVVDDFGSRVDSAANPSSEPFEVIRMQNSAVWQLPMASLAEKGSTFFRAKYVIWTSNQATFRFESITNPEAVLRRVTLKFTQYPRPEYAIERVIGRETTVTLDHFKVAEAAKTNPDVYNDVWLFDQVDAQQDPTPGDAATGGMRILKTGLSFDEVAQMCESTLLRAQVVGQAKLDHTAAYFRKCVENKGNAQGCNWFGLFGKSTSDRCDGAEWFHIGVTDVMNFTLHGEDISPSDRDFDDYNGDRRQEYEHYFQQSCFLVKGAPPVQIRWARSYLQATMMAEKARISGWSTQDQLELFGRVLASYNVPVARVKVCERHKEWNKYFKFLFKVRQYMVDLWSKVPEGWRKTISAAFETAWDYLRFGMTFVALMMTSALVREILVWLFPGLDTDRANLLKMYEDTLTEMKHYIDPPINLVLLKERLESELKITSSEKTKIDEAVMRRYRTMIQQTAESYQQKTAGDVRRNVESFQEKTNGSVRKNVESHQEQTRGDVRKNVESHQEKTQGSKKANVECTGDAEATNDQNAQEIAMKVKRNLYGIRMELDGSTQFIGNILFVVGKIAITNRHIYRLIKGKQIQLFNRSCERGIVITAEQTANMRVSFGEGIHELKDVVMMEMPRHCLVHANIKDYFMTKEDFAHHTQLASVNVLGYGSDLELQNRYSNLCQAVNRPSFNLYEGDGKQYEIREWFRYGAHTRAGDCGSVVIAYDASANRKLLGLHMAGYDSEGYLGVGVAVHQELLTALQKGLTLENAESGLDGTFALEGEATERSFGDFVNYGKAMAKTGSVNTVIRPSPVMGVIIEPKTAPAQLKPFFKNGEIVDPLEMARAKANTPNVPVEKETLKQCSRHYAQKLLDLKRDDRDDRVLTWEQAIKGDESDQWYTPVKRNTSPGYGWEAKGCGKEPWLGAGEDYITDHPQVIQRRDEMLARIFEGKRASAIFQDTLKDERRPIDRVEAGKTRLFAAGEMVYCLLVRQYFAGFAAHIMRNCILAESTVGINVFGEQWSTLAATLMEKGPHVVAGDFSNYDGTLSSAILWEVLDVIETFFEKATEEERMIRRALWCELVNSVHATVPFEGTRQGRHGFLYQWSHSQPSGNPLTVILNSVYHSIVMRYVYKLCARKYCPEMVGLDNWDRFVSHVNYGDDDITNIHEDIIEWFNQITMTEMFLVVGMVYTDESKSGNLVRSRKLEEVGFLKRKFRWDKEQGRWRCPHSMDVIREMPMWVKRGKNVHQLTAETLEEAMHELAQHPREVFEAEKGKFMKARDLVKHVAKCTFLSYDEYAEVDMARMGWMTKSDVRAEREVDAFF